MNAGDRGRVSAQDGGFAQAIDILGLHAHDLGRVGAFNICRAGDAGLAVTQPAKHGVTFDRSERGLSGGGRGVVARDRVNAIAGDESGLVALNQDLFVFCN